MPVVTSELETVAYVINFKEDVLISGQAHDLIVIDNEDIFEKYFEDEKTIEEKLDSLLSSGFILARAFEDADPHWKSVSLRFKGNKLPYEVISYFKDGDFDRVEIINDSVLFNVTMKGRRLNDILSEIEEGRIKIAYKEMNVPQVNLLQKINQDFSSFGRPVLHVLEGVADIARKHDLELFIAGGMIRDLLMGLPFKDCDSDIDLTSSKSGDATMAAFYAVMDRNLPDPDIHSYTGVATITLDVEGCSEPISIDFKGDRVQREWVVKWLFDNDFPTDYLTIDVYGRDFTINSLLLDVRLTEIVDVSGLGKIDIEERRLRTLIDSNIAVQKSPITMIRALRFLKQFDMNIDRELENAIKNNARLIAEESDRLVVHNLIKFFKYG